jgi:polyhydroxyalkanoate synthesis regulator phasin
MSEKESKDYFKKLMNDTQNKINDIDHNSNKLISEPIEDNSQKKNLTNEEAKIDKSGQNIQANMSEDEPKKSKIAIATLKMPDGKEVEIPLPPKVFKSGREGFYAQISAFVYDDEVYGGQIQVWKKTPKKDD